MNNVIKRVWNQNKMVAIEDLKGMTFQNESGGHTFQISGVDDAGNAVALSGSVAGVFLRPDNTDVAITGSASGGVVSVTLLPECYDVPGRFGLTVFVTNNGQKTAVYAAMGTVSRTSSGTVSPGTSADAVDLINRINAAVATIPASWTGLMADIAPTYSENSLYAVGAYAYYNGDLYRCISPITTKETWTSSHWTPAVLGQDVSDLESAIHPLYESTMEQGTLTAQDTSHPPTNVDSDIRIRSSNYAVWHSGDKLVLSSGYEARLFLLASNYNYISIVEWAQTVTSTNTTAAYAKVIIRKSSNTNITPEEATSAIVSDDFGLIEIKPKANQSKFEAVDKEVGTIFNSIPNLAAPYIEQGTYSATVGQAPVYSYYTIRTTTSMLMLESRLHIKVASNYQFRVIFLTDDMKVASLVEWTDAYDSDSVSYNHAIITFKKTSDDDITVQNTIDAISYCNIDFTSNIRTLSTVEKKRISIFGDSISTFAGWIPEGNDVYYTGSNAGVSTVYDTWWMKTIKALNLSLLVNNSWSGRAVSSVLDNTERHATDAGYKEANALVLKDGTTLPEIIIIKLGINDFNNNAPLGSYDGSTALPTDPSYFTNAYAMMLHNVMSNFPLAKVYCCTLMPCERTGGTGFPEINGNGDSLITWNNSIKTIAEAFGAEVLDHDVCGLTYYNLSTYMGDYTSGGAGLHPNAAGHSLIANKTIQQIDNTIRKRY